MAKMGRPKIIIDKADFESLIAINCTLDEVVAFFEHKLGGCSASTVRRFCKDEYGETFESVSKKGQALFRTSIRRNQLRLSAKSAAMAIFLGKNYLGQSDNPDNGIVELPDDGFAEAIKGTAGSDWSGEDV